LHPGNKDGDGERVFEGFGFRHRDSVSVLDAQTVPS
jgi:hypothetical protein